MERRTLTYIERQDRKNYETLAMIYKLEMQVAQVKKVTALYDTSGLMLKHFEMLIVRL